MENNTIINRKNILVNMNNDLCVTSLELIKSVTFNKVLTNYNNYLQNKNSLLYSNIYENYDNNTEDIIKLFSNLLLFELSELDFDIDSKYFIKYVESFYDYWRSLTRYSVIDNSFNKNKNYSTFIKIDEQFNELIISTYRTITENITSRSNRIYRQLVAGVNAGIVQNNMNNRSLEKYQIFNKIKIVESMILHPPFIVYPKQNTRSGIFKEIFNNPLNDFGKIDPSKYINFVIKVGKLNALICVNSKFMDLAVGIINIFELVEYENINNIDFDFIYVFGNETFEDEGYHFDTSINKYVASIPMRSKYDYFGYLKKMILTLHNLTYMKKSSLPIHGSMVKVRNKSGKCSNIVMIGDSGAGKSETIEAMNIISEEKNIELTILFDDMGVFFEDSNNIFANGTEIGAFVRLDDLDSGYPYREIDRAIFMNPHKNNSRLIIPVTMYEDIVSDEKIDYVFYINNYENKESTILSDSYKDIFLEGKRKAKGTTEETGLVSTFFSNPFGAVQKKDLTEELVEKYFNKLSKNGTQFGIVYSQLAIESMETKGPLKAAKEIIDIIS